MINQTKTRPKPRNNCPIRSACFNWLASRSNPCPFISSLPPTCADHRFSVDRLGPADRRADTGARLDLPPNVATASTNHRHLSPLGAPSLWPAFGLAQGLKHSWTQLISSATAGTHLRGKLWQYQGFLNHRAKGVLMRDYVQLSQQQRDTMTAGNNLRTVFSSRNDHLL